MLLLLFFLIETFRLFLCNKKIDNGCLDYHLGRCAGSCLATFTSSDYLVRLELAKQALQKNHSQFLQTIKENIALYSVKQEYEKAQNLCRYQRDVETIFNTLHVHYSDDKYFHESFNATNPAPHIAQLYHNIEQTLQCALGIQHAIRTIDCFDISHFQSHYIVGSCIRYIDGIPAKNMFRKFKIKSLDNQNDYAALQEIVARRYKDTNDIPDLILIDGGKGQRNAIKSILPNIPIISLAKKEERLFSDAHPEGILLNLHSDADRLLIGLRDYAHHFAINFHRKRRSQQYSSR